MSRLRISCALAALSTAWLSSIGASAQALAHPSSPAVMAPAAPTPASPAPALPVAAGRIRLLVKGASGNPPFVITGGRVFLHGTVVPYVASQKVRVSIYRDGRKVQTRTLRVLPRGDGSGQIGLAYSSAVAGLVQARAAHDATTRQGAFSGRSKNIRFASPNLGPGARGPSVRLLQSELSALHYAVPSNGVFDEATGQAVIAYRKVAGLVRVPFTNTGMFQFMQHGAGHFNVHYRRDGRHVEADLTSQVLAEIEPGGRVRSIYMMSSGKPETPTVIGRYRVYTKTLGVNEKGMVDSSYFIAGYAVHGYPEVPTYAASHGCLRVPIPDAASIYWWMRPGTPVDVYHEQGGGSRRVSGRAGP